MIDQPIKQIEVIAYNGDLQVVATGTTPSTEGYPLSLRIRDLVLRFAFESNDSKELIVRRDIEGKTLTLILCNFDNSLGSGILSPEEFGEIDNHKYYITFWVWTPNKDENKRVINWCIYRDSDIKKTAAS